MSALLSLSRALSCTLQDTHQCIHLRSAIFATCVWALVSSGGRVSEPSVSRQPRRGTCCLLPLIIPHAIILPMNCLFIVVCVCGGGRPKVMFIPPARLGATDLECIGSARLMSQPTYQENLQRDCSSSHLFSARQLQGVIFEPSHTWI